MYMNFSASHFKEPKIRMWNEGRRHTIIFQLIMPKSRSISEYIRAHRWSVFHLSLEPFPLQAAFDAWAAKES